MTQTEYSVLSFINHHRRVAASMRTAHEHITEYDAAAHPSHYDKIADCGPDPTQLLDRLAFGLQAEHFAAAAPDQVFKVEIDVVALACFPVFEDEIYNADSFNAGFKIHEVREQILTELKGAHVLGCFKPARYQNYTLGEEGTSGMVVFEAHFLVWGCTEPQLRRLRRIIRRTHKPIFERSLMAFWDVVNRRSSAHAFLELMSVPDRQYFTVDCCYVATPVVDRLSPCAKLEMKEVLKKWPLDQLVFASGDGVRIVRRAEKLRGKERKR